MLYVVVDKVTKEPEVKREIRHREYFGLTSNRTSSQFPSSQTSTEAAAQVLWGAEKPRSSAAFLQPIFVRVAVRET